MVIRRIICLDYTILSSYAKLTRIKIDLINVTVLWIYESINSVVQRSAHEIRCRLNIRFQAFEFHIVVMRSEMHNIKPLLERRRFPRCQNSHILLNCFNCPHSWRRTPLRIRPHLNHISKRHTSAALPKLIPSRAHDPPLLFRRKLYKPFRTRFPLGRYPAACNTNKSALSSRMIVQLLLNRIILPIHLTEYTVR